MSRVIFGGHQSFLFRTKLQPLEQGNEEATTTTTRLPTAHHCDDYDDDCWDRMAAYDEASDSEVLDTNILQISHKKNPTKIAMSS